MKRLQNKNPLHLYFHLFSHSLKMRTFKTFNFYKKHQSDMTPAGLAFFQCEWDKSVTNIFYELLSK